MKDLRAFTAFFLLLPAAVTGPAAAQEAVPWNAPAYSSEFKYFQEQAAQDRESWAGLTPAEQKLELEAFKAAALERHDQLAGYYNTAMKKWDAGLLRGYLDGVTDQDIKTVSLWLGREQGSALSRKISTLRALTLKAGQRGLDDTDLAALEPYLTPDTIAGMRASKLAADSVKKPEADEKTKTGLEPSKSGNDLGKFAGAESSGLSAGKFSRFYDGSAAAGDSEGPSSGVRLSAQKRTAPPADPMGIVPGKPLKMAGIPPSPSAQAAAASGNKSAAFTSDAYGITLETNEGTRTFRKTSDAEAAIRQMPDGSVKKVIFYGHGSPGMQMVGPDSYDSDSASGLLKGKMAKNGVVQFAGCNTSSIGGATLNPAVGLSMAARRLLYFSLPYFQDRADGVPAEQAGRQWEKTWNADLARDTSLGVKGAIVCGYRTFGLVPGRLPGITRLLGNQEAATPGYVAGKKACYRDGQEVPAP